MNVNIILICWVAFAIAGLIGFLYFFIRFVVMESRKVGLVVLATFVGFVVLGLWNMYASLAGFMIHGSGQDYLFRLYVSYLVHVIYTIGALVYLAGKVRTV